MNDNVVLGDAAEPVMPRNAKRRPEANFGTALIVKTVVGNPSSAE